MTGPEILNRAFAEIAAHPWFWAFLAASLVLVTACAMQCFAKKWLRAIICGSLAIECAWALNAGLFG